MRIERATLAAAITVGSLATTPPALADSTRVALSTTVAEVTGKLAMATYAVTVRPSGGPVHAESGLPVQGARTGRPWPPGQVRTPVPRAPSAGHGAPATPKVPGQVRAPASPAAAVGAGLAGLWESLRWSWSSAQSRTPVIARPPASWTASRRPVEHRPAAARPERHDRPGGRPRVPAQLETTAKPGKHARPGAGRGSAEASPGVPAPTGGPVPAPGLPAMPPPMPLPPVTPSPPPQLAPPSGTLPATGIPEGAPRMVTAANEDGWLPSDPRTWISAIGLLLGAQALLLWVGTVFYLRRRFSGSK